MLKDHIDPTCGPDTYVAAINRSLADTSLDIYYNRICRNKSDYFELLTCQLSFSKVRGYGYCLLGETLNKTIDYADPCIALNSGLGCMYKYVKIMCPNAINAFIVYTNNTRSCDVNFENSQEAMSCDDDMEKACSVAYKPPPFNSTASEFAEFICSDRSRGLQKCLRNVLTMCKDRDDYNVSALTSEIQLYETQTAILCSDHKGAVDIPTIASSSSNLQISMLSVAIVVWKAFVQSF